MTAGIGIKYRSPGSADRVRGRASVSGSNTAPLGRAVRWEEPWYYAGPYVWSGVNYGHPHWPSRCHWLVPGTNPEDRYPAP